MAVTDTDAIAEAVAIELGRDLTEVEEAQVEQWVGDAESLISARLGDLTLLDASLLAYVLRSAVVERMRNPEGTLESTEKIDDYSISKKMSGTKRVTIWPEWWDLLSPAKRRRAFSVMPD